MSACINCNYHVMDLVVFLFFVGTTVKFGYQPILTEWESDKTALQSHFHRCRIGSQSSVLYVFSNFISEIVQINQHCGNSSSYIYNKYLLIFCHMPVALWSMVWLNSVPLCLLPTKATLNSTIQVEIEAITHLSVRKFRIFRHS